MASMCGKKIRTARRAIRNGFFSAELVDVFEPIVQEEARHIFFFVNCVSYEAANRGFAGGFLFRFQCLAALAAAGLGRMSLAGVADYGKSKDNFIVAGGETLTKDLTARNLIETALEENERRLRSFNPHLPWPKIMPFIAKLALGILKLFPEKKKTVRA